MDDEALKNTTVRNLLLLLLLLVMAARAFWAASVAPAPGIDYYQFWLVGAAESRGRIENIYSTEGRDALLQVGKEILAENPRAMRLAAAADYRRNIETFSTPLLYLAVASIASGTYGADFNFFQGLALASVALAIALSCRMCGYSWITTLLVMLVALICSDPLNTNAQVGNVNTFQLGALAVYAWLLRRPSSSPLQFVAGGLIAATILFKPTLGLVLPLVLLGWILRRQWRPVGMQLSGAAAASVLVIAASSIFLRSSRAWLDWLTTLPTLELARERSIQRGNFCISRIAEELGAPDISTPLLVITVAISFAMVWLANRHHCQSASSDQGGSAPRQGFDMLDARDYLAVSLGCAVSVVALRLVWMHYYLLMAPLAIYLFRPRATPTQYGRGSYWRWLEFSLVCAAIAGVLGGPVRLVASTTSLQAVAVSFALSATILLTLGWVELYRSKPAAAELAGSHGADLT